MEKKLRRDKAIKDITEKDELEKIIRKCEICHVSMVDGDEPYVLGFNFGYENDTIYIHTLDRGKKMDILRKNPNVCVAFDTDYKVFARNHHVGCSWRMAYRSVLAYAKASIIDDYDEKLEALKTLMKNYSGDDFSFNKPSVNNISIIALKVSKLTGRSFEY